MSIVNQVLSYKMKCENDTNTSNEVQLVGFTTNDDHKMSRLGYGNLPPPRYSSQPEQQDKGVAYDNIAFHQTELDNCRCSINRSNQNNSTPEKTGYSNGNTNGNYALSLTDQTDSDSRSSWTEDTVRRCCSRKVLYKRIQILSLLENYRKDMIMSDLVAGITVGLTMIPQAIAYANVAGLPVKYGLYSSFMASFIYVILGTCKESSIGPTAIQAILIRENIHGLGPSFAILLCFLSGIVQLIMGALQLGFLIDFISGPVSAGFTSAAAIVIASTQVKDLLGLKFSASQFVDVWNQLAEHYHEVQVWDAVLGFSCLAILLLLRKIKDIPIGPTDTKEKSPLQTFLGGFLWLMSTARNILVVLFSSALAYIFVECMQMKSPFVLTGTVEPGLPPIQMPPFSATVQNATYDFFDMASKLSSGIIIVPLLSLLEDVSSPKVFSSGQSIDATQELIALGACNLVSSFFSSISLSGGLSRGAINNACGAKSTFGSIYSGILVIIALQFFTHYFQYIPKAALAAVIIAAVIFMIELNVVKPMWRTKKMDLIPAIATFLACLLLRLEVGILVGVSINVLYLLYGSARPTVHVDKFKSEWGYEYIVITPDRSLAFPSVEYVRSVVSKAGLKQGYSSIPVVIDSRHVQGADFTAAKGIKSLIEDFVNRNQLLLFYNLKPSVVDIFRGVKPTEFHHCQTEQELLDFLKEYHFKSSNTNTSKVKY